MIIAETRMGVTKQNIDVCSVGGGHSLLACAPCANHARKTAMLLVHPERSLDTCAAQTDGERSLPRRLLLVMRTMGLQLRESS